MESCTDSREDSVGANRVHDRVALVQYFFLVHYFKAQIDNLLVNMNSAFSATRRFGESSEAGAQGSPVRALETLAGSKRLMEVATSLSVKRNTDPVEASRQLAMLLKTAHVLKIFEWTQDRDEEVVGEVALVGSWTEWLTLHPMTASNFNRNTWTVGVRLSPGRHEFKFVVDGVWRKSVEYDTTDDGVGTDGNNVINVRQDDVGAPLAMQQKVTFDTDCDTAHVPGILVSMSSNMVGAEIRYGFGSLSTLWPTRPAAGESEVSAGESEVSSREELSHRIEGGGGGGGEGGVVHAWQALVPPVAGPPFLPTPLGRAPAGSSQGASQKGEAGTDHRSAGVSRPPRVEEEEEEATESRPSARATEVPRRGPRGNQTVPGVRMQRREGGRQAGREAGRQAGREAGHIHLFSPSVSLSILEGR